MNDRSSAIEKEGFDDRQWEFDESDRDQIERINERGKAKTMRKIRYDASDESNDSTTKHRRNQKGKSPIIFQIPQEGRDDWRRGSRRSPKMIGAGGGRTPKRTGLAECKKTHIEVNQARYRCR